MTRELVFFHGRSQQDKDSVSLKAEWVESLRKGMAKSDLELPIAEASVRFPYYGDTLVQLIAGRTGDDLARIIVRGTDADEAAQALLEEVVREVKEEKGFSDADALAAAGDSEVLGRGFQNSKIVLGVLRLLDERAPHAAAGKVLALATNDVYHYLYNKRVQAPIDEGVREAMSPGVESVVVGHSLGSVVAYKMLKEQGMDRGWKVPAFITVGSPLGLGAIAREVGVAHPTSVAAWFNALDPQDVVALRPLSSPWFDVDPAVVNKTDVRNATPNQHGISGYLEDPEVAARIHQALVGS